MRTPIATVPLLEARGFPVVRPMQAVVPGVEGRRTRGARSLLGVDLWEVEARRLVRGAFRLLVRVAFRRQARVVTALAVKTVSPPRILSWVM